MTLPDRLIVALRDWAFHRALRAPDFVVQNASADRVYLNRWHLLPRNPICNVYLHQFLTDDDDRALHDHPWGSVSLTLSGYYDEVLPLRQAQQPAWDYIPGYTTTRRHHAGDVVWRRARLRHRLVIPPTSAWTLFITGPVLREWGFHCRNGWVPWSLFVDARDHGRPGAACDATPRKPLSLWRVWRSRGA